MTSPAARWIERFVGLLCVLALAFVCSGCATARAAWEKVSEYAVVGAITAGMAVVGFFFGGPIGGGVGAFAGSIAAGSIADTAQLQSGTVVGEAALEKELARWKGEARAARERAAWYDRWLRWASIGFGVLFYLRNSAHLRVRFGWKLFLRGLGHSLFGERWVARPVWPDAAPAVAAVQPEVRT